ncbi:hypothetical protein MVEG_05848 [Podila verticillata NRRL 6337]|nr:hypothetical protein MVEG_05848 [Podila verticillata NRRL 6337]
MLATSAPINHLNTQAHKPQVNTVKVRNCVHISIPGSINAVSSDLRTASQGEKLSISIDPSECDQSVVQSATPWTVFLGNANDKSAKAVVLAHMLAAGKTEYIWEAHAPSQEQQLTASSPPEYYIQAQTTSQDGKILLMGRSDLFTIADTIPQLQGPVYASLPPSRPTIPQDPTKLDLPRPFKRSDNKQTLDAQAVLQTPAVLPDQMTKDAKDASTHEASAQAPEASAQAPEESPQALEAPPQTAAGAKADIAGVQQLPTPPAAVADPVPQDIPKPHYPNTPNDTPPPDPSTLPKPSAPNTRSPSDPVKNPPPPPEKAIPPKPTAAQTFLKYAGAGAAILSTVGLGLGGLVGGMVGGTLGFVIGLIGATANAAYNH